MEVFLIIFGLVLVVMTLVDSARQSELHSSPTVIAVKQCPPHKWSHVEVKDTEGNTARWDIVCAICGPLKRQEKPQGGDYS